TSSPAPSPSSMRWSPKASSRSSASRSSPIEPGRSVRAAEGTGLPGGVEDEEVGGDRVGPPPVQGGVEEQAEEDGGRQQSVDEGDAAFGTQDGVVERGSHPGLAGGQREHDGGGESRPDNAAGAVASAKAGGEYPGGLHAQV